MRWILPDLIPCNIAVKGNQSLMFNDLNCKRRKRKRYCKYTKYDKDDKFVETKSRHPCTRSYELPILCELTVEYCRNKAKSKVVVPAGRQFAVASFGRNR